MYIVWGRGLTSFFAYRYPVFLAPFVEKTLLSPLDDLLTFFFFYIIYLAAPGLSHHMRRLRCGTQILHCSAWDPVPWPGIEPRPYPCVGSAEAQPLDRREVPVLAFLKAWVLGSATSRWVRGGGGRLSSGSSPVAVRLSRPGTRHH